ncbi:MAG: DegT/DnrJ/EryC1/StrS family aminotransferase [Candidatus Melainabacteria bacterium]|nr:DegT/DnrJ/EryC1/StrS family aminotransferase [Candidatus Melainabacteria bacterium]
MTKKIPIVNLTQQYALIQNEIKEAVLNVLSSGHYILGKNVEAFEKELAEYLDCKFVVSCANGTDAIYLALRALEIGHGDEVITVANSFFATSEAIALASAKPVFVDIKEDDYNINPQKIEERITKKTKAILPVHLYGGPCEIASVVEIAKKYELYVIEDCAQAIGAKLNNKFVGTFGDIGTVSFFPTKNLGACGDGGAIFTNNEDVAKKIKQLRVHGSPKRYVHDYIGLNSRLDEIQAAILRIKLKYLDDWNLKRTQAAKHYDILFEDLDIILPTVKPSCQHVFHQYTVRTKHRDLLYEKLNEHGIETLIYYLIPIHLQKAFSSLNYKKGDLPVTEKVCNEILSLPMYPEITKEIQGLVVEKIKQILLSCASC